MKCMDMGVDDVLDEDINNEIGTICVFAFWDLMIGS